MICTKAHRIDCLAVVFTVCIGCAHAAMQPAENLTRLQDYNVVWDSPSPGFHGSMPLGNGDVGLNAWVQENGDLHFYIGKTDSWGDNARLLKVGKIRVRITPDPWQEGRDFRQCLSLAEGAIHIRYGKSEKALTLKLWVDAFHPVIHVDAQGESTFALTASVELWRTEAYELPSIEVSDVHLHRGIPGNQHAPTVVEPDTVLPNLPNRIGWYHHNVKSVGPELTMRQQGLSSYEMADPLLHRTFGAIVTADDGKRVDDVTLTTSPATSQHLSIYVLTRHPSTPDAWLKSIDRVIRSVEARSPEAHYKIHRGWWADFWNRSWIYARGSGKQSIVSVPPNQHPVRIGVDQQGQNVFQGVVGRVSIFSTALSPSRIRQLAHLDKARSPAPEAGLLYAVVSPGRGPISNSAGWTFSQDVTLEAWVRPAKLPAGGARIIDKITPGGSDGFLLDTYPGNSLRLVTAVGTLEAKNALPANRWSHVAALIDHDRGRLSLFVDGKEIAEEGFENRADASVVTRAYILQRFINACNGRGAYPIKFNGAIFTVPNPGSPGDADYRRWGPGYWWQNTRSAYFGMCTAGDFDQMGPLFDMYAGPVFELSKYRTQHYFGQRGVYYPECIYFWGAAFSESYGWTPFEQREDKLQESRWHKWEWVCGPELVWMMLDYYDHTLDEAFLRERVLPVADGVLAFFDQYYETDSAGKLVMHPSQAVETWWECTNPMPEVAGLHAVSQRLLSLPDSVTTSPQRRYWKSVQAKLPDIPTRQIDGVTMLAPAEKFDMKRNIENPELYAVFPFRLIALGKPSVELGIKAFEHRWDKGNHGWRQEEIFMAYLGLTDQVRDNLVRRARNKHKGSRFPAFWGPNYDWTPDQTHGGVLMKAFQSMLLQTDGKKIYLLPAWPREWNVDFKLHAPYKTIVQGRVRNGEVQDLDVSPPSRRADIVLRN